MRNKKHPEYYLVTAVQKVLGLSDEFMANELCMSVRTFKDKVRGWNDFTPLEARRISELLHQPKDVIFLTKMCRNETQLYVRKVEQKGA